jgi:hypothetical protein
VPVFFFNFLVALLEKILNTKMLLASMKKLTNSETSQKPLQNFSSASLYVIGRFSPVITSHWTIRKSAFLIPVNESGVLT